MRAGTFAAENTAARGRLIELTTRLTDADMARQLPNGWSVAGAFVHLAFWDRYALALIEGWERGGYSAIEPTSPAQTDAINEAVQVLSRAIPPAASPHAAVAAAEAIDRKLEQIAPELAADIERGGRERLLRRALHRREHLDQIEQALAV